MFLEFCFWDVKQAEVVEDVWGTNFYMRPLEAECEQMLSVFRHDALPKAV